MTPTASTSAATPNVPVSGSQLTSCGWWCGMNESCASAAPADARAAIAYRIFMFTSSADRIVHGDELGPVGERRFHLDVVDHFRNAGHHLRAREHMRAGLHELGDGPAVPRAFHDEIGDQRHRLRMIELDAALEPSARDHRRH